jgi:DNA-binding XRE family transcriptional regulator
MSIPRLRASPYADPEKMKALYLPYEGSFDEESACWGVIGRDSAGDDFGVGVGETIEEAERRLRAWVLDSLVAAASDGEDRLGDLVQEKPAGEHLAFTPLDLLPIRLRQLRARRELSQAQVAERLGMSQQAYAKLERPGANPELRTLVQVERALDAELLRFAG